MNKNENKDRGQRIAIMAIKENTPKDVEQEILNLISEGDTLNDLKDRGYSTYLT